MAKSPAAPSQTEVAAKPLIGVPLAAILIALVMLRFYPEELRPLGLFAVLLAAVLLAVAMVFSYRYDTLIPGTFGPHRLYDYVCLLGTLLVLGCLEPVVGLLSRVRAWLPATEPRSPSY